jgi:alkylhydroperoxidase family enzyme
MKTAALAGGVKVPAFAELSSPLDLVAFARSHGYPIVVKPRAEAGARGVRVLHSMADVRSWLAAPLPADFMVERYVDGAMYHVNGLAVAGRIEFCCSFRYLTDCLGYQSQRSLGAFLLDPDDPIGARLCRATQETIAALPAADQLAFHAEFFRTRDDELVFCEIAARPGGSRTAEVIEVAYGFNMYEAWARQSVGLPVTVNRVQTGSAGNLMIPPWPGRLQAIPDVAPFDWVLDYHKNARVGQHFDVPDTCAAHVALFIVAGEPATQVAARLQEVDEWFGAHTRWAR